MPSTVTRHLVTKCVRQGRTPIALTSTQTRQAAAAAHARMLAAKWEFSEDVKSLMPPHNPRRDGAPSPSYDAFKYCADWDDGRYTQHVHAGCACYTLAVPADALAGAPCAVESVAFTLFGDRWLQDGARAFVAFSNDDAPLADMDEIAALPNATAPLMAVTPSNTGADSSAAVALSIQGAQPANPKKYIHVYLLLADYLTHRGAWVEGSATLDADSLAVTYSRDVAEDDLARGECVLTPSPVDSDFTLLQNHLSHADNLYVRESLRISFSTETITELAVKNAVMSAQSGLSLNFERTVFSKFDALVRVGGVAAGMLNAPTPGLNQIFVMNFYTAGFAIVNPARPITGVRVPFSIPETRRAHGINARLCIYIAHGHPFNFDTLPKSVQTEATVIGKIPIKSGLVKTTGFWRGKATELNVEKVTAGAADYEPSPVPVDVLFNDVLQTAVQPGDIIPCNHAPKSQFCWVVMATSVDSFSPLGKIELSVKEGLQFLDASWGCDNAATRSLIQR